jgi:pyruvate,orthophosphate dikinase
VTLVFDLDHDHGLPLQDLKNLVGGKAANINVMATRLKLPVPPGFVVTTATCHAYLVNGWPESLDEEIRDHMARTEAVVGRRFGDPKDPLLVSVRSGAPISMPGMMDTILNLGLNDATAAGLGAAAGDPGFARNCHERFNKSFKDIVGVDVVPEDPWLQLRGAVEAVFRSWNGDRARTYRRHEHIPDDLGTAVTVQTMVFGNRGSDSGTGVLFTRDPATGENVLSGDVLFNAQGEDVVAGTHRTEPVSVLDTRLPAVGRELRDYATQLERHYADMCDIEFTIEQGKLWMLQVRVGKRTARAALHMAIDMAEDPAFPLTRAEAVKRVASNLERPPLISRRVGSWPVRLAAGKAASPGIAHGEIVTTPDAAQAAAAEGRKVILVRTATSPDDIHGMEVSAGVLTASGGLNSHAAVVARGWEIPAVVGAEAIEVHDTGMMVGGASLACGRVITIDGSTGEVFEGQLPYSCDVVPEAGTLLAWAGELGITVGEAGDAAKAAAEAPAPQAAAPAELSAEDVLRGLMVKGLVPPEGLATALASTADQVIPFLDGLLTEGLVEATAGSFRLTGEGKLKALDVFAADRERAGGEEACVAALNRFVLLDCRMKDLVTAWQIRDVANQVFNDHGDAAYDALILEQLGALHGEVVDWLTPIGTTLWRMACYRERLERALALARGGNQKFVASPRVDSYHSVWFELHEDLIRLSGRRRSDEAAAGRA